MKLFLACFILLFVVTGCSTLPSGVQYDKPDGQRSGWTGEKIVYRYQDHDGDGDGDKERLYGVYDDSKQQWVYSTQFVEAKKFRLNSITALKAADSTWQLYVSGKKYTIAEKLAQLECKEFNKVCIGKDAGGNEYFYDRKNKFKLLSGGRKWEQFSEHVYRTPAKQDGLYYYKTGEYFFEPESNHIGTLISYDLGTGNKVDGVSSPIKLKKYKVNDQVLWGLGSGAYAKPLCKTIELKLFQSLPSDGVAKRANFICQKPDGTYISFAKFNISGWWKFVETGAVHKWAEGADRKQVIAKSESMWDKAIKHDFNNIAREEKNKRELEARIAAKKANIARVAKALFDNGVSSRNQYSIKTCVRFHLNLYECEDAYKGAETLYIKANSGPKKSWKDIDRNVYNTRNGTGGGSNSGFDARAAKNARDRDMKRFNQTMDYISGRSTYDPTKSYRINR